MGVGSLGKEKPPLADARGASLGAPGVSRFRGYRVARRWRGTWRSLGICHSDRRCFLCRRHGRPAYHPLVVTRMSRRRTTRNETLLLRRFRIGRSIRVRFLRRGVTPHSIDGPVLAKLIEIHS